MYCWYRSLSQLLSPLRQSLILSFFSETYIHYKPLHSFQKRPSSAQRLSLPLLVFIQQSNPFDCHSYYIYNMKYSGFLAAAALASLANAHTTIWNMYSTSTMLTKVLEIQQQGTSAPTKQPVNDITSADMTCNINNVATAKTVTVAAGDKVRLILVLCRKSF